MSLINIISAIGNNSSIYPLIVRDCGIEVPTKVAMTYNQNLKESKQKQMRLRKWGNTMLTNRALTSCSLKMEEQS